MEYSFLVAVRTRARAGKPLATERGFLVIADISGYTRYVVESPLEYAEDVVADVTESLSTQLSQVLSINKQEGDAVFGYVLSGSVDGPLLLDVIEVAYFEFRNRIESIEHATSCDCNACVKVTDLDLKFVVHFGEFIRRPTPNAEELTGSAVIVAHRLLKTHAGEAAGLGGYALLTEESVAELGLNAQQLGLVEHVDRFEDVGEVRSFLTDLEARWGDERERRRVKVGAREAAFELETFLPVPPPVAWEYLTSPSKRVRWQMDGIQEANPTGRRLAGTASVCVDGRLKIYEEIVDWRPFKYLTEVRTLFGVKMILTTELELADGGTKVRTRAKADRSRRRPSDVLAGSLQKRRLRHGYNRLEALLAEEG